MMIFIYALLDPFTIRIRYVGKTIDPNRRYPKHLYTGNPEKMAWIRELDLHNTRPVFHILELLPDDGDWASRERYWIAQCKADGYDLFNQDDGGKGGKQASEATRQRLRVSHLGFQHSEMTRRKISHIVKGRKHKPETIEKLRNRPHTWGNKISVSKMGHEVSEGSRQKMSERRIAYFDRLGRQRDIAVAHFKEHPEDLSLSCRSVGRKLDIGHHHVAEAKRQMGVAL